MALAVKPRDDRGHGHGDGGLGRDAAAVVVGGGQGVGRGDSRAHGVVLPVAGKGAAAVHGHREGKGGRRGVQGRPVEGGGTGPCRWSRKRPPPGEPTETLRVGRGTTVTVTVAVDALGGIQGVRGRQGVGGGDGRGTRPGFPWRTRGPTPEIDTFTAPTAFATVQRRVVPFPMPMAAAFAVKALMEGIVGLGATVTVTERLRATFTPVEGVGGRQGVGQGGAGTGPRGSCR